MSGTEFSQLDIFDSFNIPGVIVSLQHSITSNWFIAIIK